jgi:GNAT superfamily N-acetyltransferase
MPQQAWHDGVAACHDLSEAHRGTRDRMLASLRVPSGFAVLREEDAPVAYGLAVAERGMVGLFDIVTVPGRRRHGYGRRVVAALLAWGRTQGATTAYLQVTTVNHPALALYAALGFREAYRYHYRVRQTVSR